MSLFVDTSVWYAAADAGDAGNRLAKRLLSTGESLVTTDHVLLETWLLLRYRFGYDAATAFWQGLTGGVARVEPVGEADLALAGSIAETFPDQDFSLADCTSFAVMQRLGLRRVASLDAHFAIFRFGRGRKQAFEVVQ
jgi:uncharacterized protein